MASWFIAPPENGEEKTFKKEKYWIIDYSFYIWNGTHALRQPCGCDGKNKDCRCGGKGKYFLHNKNGDVISGLHFVLSQIIYRLRAGWKVITAFDPPRDQLIRTQLLDTYKGQRPSVPDYVKSQMDIGKILLSFMGNVECYYSDCDESDDVIATLAVEKALEGHEVVVASDDKDMYPLLVYPNITLYRQHTFFSAKDFTEKFGFAPERFDEYLAITGDVADNFNLIKGLGDVAAKYFILNYKNIMDLFDDWDNIPSKYQKKLSDFECIGNMHDVCSKCEKYKNLILFKDQLELSLRLAKLQTKAQYRKVNKEPDIELIRTMLQDLELKQALENIELFFEVDKC